MSVPKGSAGVMASFLEAAGYSGEFEATVLTQIKGVPNPGVVVGVPKGRSAVQLKVQASTSQDERRIFNLIVPSGCDPEKFYQKLKETEAVLNQKVVDVSVCANTQDEEADQVVEVEEVDSVISCGLAEVIVEADEETVLIAEAYALDDERGRLDSQIEQLSSSQTSSHQALERKRVERTSLERRLMTISQEINDTEAAIYRDAETLVALRERHRQVVVRREEVEARVDSLSAQRSVDEAVSRAKPTVEGLMSELKGLSDKARQEALQKIVAMLES